MSKILITGATGSIGSHLAKYLASKGHSLVLTARNETRLETVANEIGELYDIKSEYCISNFADTASLLNVAAFAIKQKIDGLVLMPPQPPETTECLPEDHVWESMFKTSFIGPTALIRNLTPALTATRASVVLLSGISSVQPLSQYATSNVLRTMWLGEIKTLADVYGPQGVRFNTVSLGGIRTEIFNNKIQAESEKTGLTVSEILSNKFANVPLRKYAELNEIANMIEFLLTSEASRHMTGANHKLDGGFLRPY